MSNTVLWLFCYNQYLIYWITKGVFNMTDKEFVSMTMNKIAVIKEYREKYGEEDIIAYYNSYGTYAGIEGYLNECIAKRQS